MARKESWSGRIKGGPVITPQLGCWIKFQLDLRNLAYRHVAEKAGVSESMVHNFVKGRKRSARVCMALVETLGFESFGALVAASRGKKVV